MAVRKIVQKQKLCRNQIWENSKVDGNQSWVDTKMGLKLDLVGNSNYTETKVETENKYGLKPLIV